MTATKFQTKRKSGQAMLLLVLVALVASLGLALSVANRSNLQQRGSVYNVQGEQAYSAAESGLDAMLESFSSSTPSCDDTISLTDDLNNSTYTVTAECVRGEPGNSLLTDEFTLTENTPEIFYLNGKVANVEIAWQNQGNSEPALEINLYKTDNPYSFEQKAYYWHDSPLGNLEEPGWDNASNKSTVDVDDKFTSDVSNMSIIQITPRNADAHNITLNFTPIDTNEVPLQGYTITSVGTAGKSQRTIKAFYRPADVGNMINNIFYTLNSPATY